MRSSDSGIQSWRRSIAFAVGAAARHSGPVVARRARDGFRPVSFDDVDITKAICKFKRRYPRGVRPRSEACSSSHYLLQTKVGLHSARFAH